MKISVIAISAFLGLAMAAPATEQNEARDVAKELARRGEKEFWDCVALRATENPCFGRYELCLPGYMASCAGELEGGQ